MLLQSIVSLSIIFVYGVFCVFEKQISVALKFIEDSSPGKQMAIDADLNSGAINENEAIIKRKKLSDVINLAKKGNFLIQNFILFYTVTILILLIINTSFIIFNPEIVKIYSIILIIINVLLFCFWIVFWNIIKSKINI